MAGGLAILASLSLGCGRAVRVADIRLDPEPGGTGRSPAAVTGYAEAVEAIAAIMRSELGLPLPRQLRVFVYPGGAAYAEGLVRHGSIGPARARRIAAYSIALGQRGRLFINDGALRGKPRAAWLGVVAHELTHLAQYELSGGRRGTSEQWLREGMADWVAAYALDRLGEDPFGRRRQNSLAAVAPLLLSLAPGKLTLSELGTPLGWERQQIEEPPRPLYRLAFLLADQLAGRGGFGSLVAYFQAFASHDDRAGHFHRAFGLPLEQFERTALSLLRLEARRAGPPPPCEHGVEPAIGPSELPGLDLRGPCPD